MAELAIEANDLTRKFGEMTAVSSLNLQVEKQQIYGFLGPNGWGKPPLFACLLAYSNPVAATLRY